MIIFHIFELFEILKTLRITNQHARRSVCLKDLARDCFAIEVTKRNVSKTKPVFQAQWVCAVICSRHIRGTEADILATGSLYLYSSNYFDILNIRQYCKSIFNLRLNRGLKNHALRTYYSIPISKACAIQVRKSFLIKISLLSIVRDLK